MSSLEKTVLGTGVLGQKTTYPKSYDKSLLFPVSRKNQRDAMGFPNKMLFYGFDVWNAFEVSFLNKKGRPVRKIMQVILPCQSKFLPESKSVKLYLNSLNHTKFSDEKEVLETIKKDLEEVCQEDVSVQFEPQNLTTLTSLEETGFINIDNDNIEISSYEQDSTLLKTSGDMAEESLVSHSFKSHCLCTGQPDWGSIFIKYQGHKVCHESLLKYLLSYHNHKGFSENCIEQIFMDFMLRCKPNSLVVFGLFLRRGGIDINPYRSSYPLEPKNHMRLVWQ